MMEQVGGFLPQQIVEEIGSVVRQERSSERIVEQQWSRTLRLGVWFPKRTLRWWVPSNVGDKVRVQEDAWFV